MLKKKISAKYLFQNSSKPQKRDEESIKSSLLDLVESTHCDDYERLELRDQKPSCEPLGNDHCAVEELPQIRDSSTSSDDYTASQIYSSSAPTNTCANAKQSSISDLQTLNYRRDSGLSGCSYQTSTPRSTSAPVTPSYQDLPCGELRFQYPVTSTSSVLSSTVQTYTADHSLIDKTTDSSISIQLQLL